MSDGAARLLRALGGRLAFGADYNPEQWPNSLWREDIALMREAGVTLVTVGVFSWALLEPEEGRYDFTLFDEVLALLHDNGIAVDLATGTASPPAWFSHAYPHTLPVDAQGIRRGFGARQAYCPSAPEYRRAAAALAGAVAARYAEHPAVVLWHINNEYGCHNWHCFCEVSAQAFRGWLQGRYTDLDALNDAWGTAFWSQRYTAWEQVPPPRAVAYRTFANPGQQLDWWRFSSDELLACYRAEADAVRAVARQPVTTNFMNFFKPLDYRRWAGELDLVSNDHYLLGADPEPAQQLAMSADLMRSLAGGDSWLLMEHSTSAVNWQPHNLAKAPGQMLRNSLQHIARGSDGAMFFQWRASRAGAEKFHSGLVPHGGTATRVWSEVVQLGRHLQSLAEIAGTTVEPASVGLLFDWDAWWAAELDSHPSVDVSPLAEARRWHDSLWARSVGVDVPGPRDDLSRYRVLIVPVQYVMAESTARALADAAAAGTHVVVTYFSGIADERDHIGLGGYPALLRELLGIRVEEFYPLLPGQEVPLSRFGTARTWTELTRSDGAEVLASYDGGDVAGSPAVTRRPVGRGAAWYVGTELSAEARDDLLDQLLDAAGVRPVVPVLPRGVEALRRAGDGRSYLFVVNHTGREVTVPATGADLISGRGADGALTVAAGGVAVVRESRSCA